MAPRGEKVWAWLPLGREEGRGMPRLEWMHGRGFLLEIQVKGQGPSWMGYVGMAPAEDLGYNLYIRRIVRHSSNLPG